MKLKTAKTLLDSLNNIKIGIIYRHGRGICSNVLSNANDADFSEIIIFLKSVFGSLGLSKSHPVENMFFNKTKPFDNKNEYDYNRAYHSQENKFDFDNPYAIYRYELLNILIQKTEALIKELENASI
ncbi:dolichol-phosphate mannosyltransferase [Pectobacterium phage POP12]|nr:dolichol-phosphate mannosyltransferase [Pectobacterium phage POP12]